MYPIGDVLGGSNLENDLETLVKGVVSEVLLGYVGCELTAETLFEIEKDVSQAVSQVMVNCAWTGVM